MQAVISVEQARKITGGRTPLVPVEYETACRMLVECSTLDEAKLWDNKADALAAWAKMYRSDEAGRNAKRLKGHAYRRMSQLAEELRPKAPNKLLRDHGFRVQKAIQIRRVGAIDQKSFDAMVSRPAPPSIRELALAGRGLGENRGRPMASDAWLKISDQNNASLTKFRMFIRRESARELACGLRSDEREKARGMITEAQEWLDEFEQHLPNNPASGR